MDMPLETMAGQKLWGELPLPVCMAFAAPTPEAGFFIGFMHMPLIYAAALGL